MFFHKEGDFRPSLTESLDRPRPSSDSFFLQPSISCLLPPHGKFPWSEDPGQSFRRTLPRVTPPAIPAFRNLRLSSARIGKHRISSDCGSESADLWTFTLNHWTHPFLRYHLAFAIPFRKRKGLRLSCKAPALLPSGVCPFLFCDIIISSTLHNVKCYFSFFHGYIRQRNPVCFSVFPSFQARPDLL